MLVRAAPLAIAIGVVVGLVPSPAAAPGRNAMPPDRATPPTHRQPAAPSHLRRVPRPRTPLHGVRLAIDPGHQLGNHNFPQETNRTVQAGAGGFSKACNTTGTATDSGVPEATVVWQVARLVRNRLERLGATVLLTRHRNSEHSWGPCVSTRGRFGGRHHVRLTLSIHADGAASTLHGFHVIAPARGRLIRPAIVVPSARLSRKLRAGLDAVHLPRSNYIGGGTALDRRTDLATLDLSRVPVAMVEIGNMRNRADAHRMTTRAGRDRYAAGLVRGMRSYLSR